ncbi:unnamed protein product [Didymodactylos carnosus]|uniref:Purine-cytosine permease n=1 Tax=Didymodactylos carnosus TaxID=1234261 RepID=A0A8S2DW88_9BILA|nr:unnamed protein product [Didymodactylos carnosus]CAF3793118.1 unnamed protein product [Didymodactylos carnosus]
MATTRSASLSSTNIYPKSDVEIELSTAPTDSTLVSSTGRWARFSKILNKLDSVGLEARGIARITPEERTDSKLINTAMIWVAANTFISCFAIGTLGPAVFNLGLYDSFATVTFFNLLGALPVAAMACAGPASGLRTMAFSRFSWGYYGASLAASLNCIAAIGWSAVNCITGGQTLRVVSNNTLPVAVGVIIIAICTLVLSFAGYKWIHIYERYSWIPVFIAFCIMAGVGAKNFTNSGQAAMKSGRIEAANVLSFGGTVFGFAVAWTSLAADYNAYFPEDTSSTKVFTLTYLGNIIPLMLIEFLGAAVYTGTYTNSAWASAYNSNSIGGLIGASLSSVHGFGKFLLILFALSIVANNIPNTYSLSLSAQVIAPVFSRIPRFIYTIVATAIYIPIAIVGAAKFNESLTTFMDVLSYWLAIFIAVVFEEHILFKRCSFKNYDFSVWNNRKALPISFAAIGAGLIGVCGAVLGMSQTHFVGPIGKVVGVTDHNNSFVGADVGFEMAFAFTAIIYPLFRFIELRFIGR